MNDLTEFEHSICEVYANFHVFDSGEVEWVFRQLRSFDKTLLILQMATTFDISLGRAIEISKI